MTHTKNYSLSQWDETDRIMMQDFNADNARIDAALADHATDIAILNGSKGNCRIETFTYTGTGKEGTGMDNPTVIRFPAMPVFYIILGDVFLAGVGGAGWARVSGVSNGAVNISVATEWEGSTVKIFENRVALQANRQGVIYTVVAFYAL